MAPTDRQERRRMRERGAGITRDIKNTDFAFKFGTVAQIAPRSSRKTPQPPSRRSTSKQTPAAQQARTVTGKTPATESASRASTNRKRSERPLTHGQSSASAQRSTRRGAPGATFTPSVTGKRKRSSDAITVPDNEEDELEHEDVIEAITGRRSWGEQIPAPRRKQSLVPVAEDAMGQDELEQEDVAHDISNTSRLSLGRSPLVSSVPAEQEAGPQPTLDPELETLTDRPKTPGSRKRPVQSKTGTQEAQQEHDAKENETHSTFIRRMYNPRQPLKTVDGPSQQRKAPVAPMFDVSLDEIEPLAGEPSSILALNDATTSDRNIDPSLNDITYTIAPADNIDDVSVRESGLPDETPMFVRQSEAVMSSAVAKRNASPIRGRKKRRTNSLGTNLHQEESEDTAEVRSGRKTKRPRALERQQRSARTESNDQVGSTVEEQNEAAGSRNPTAISVPITVYRLSRPPALDDDDELNETSSANQSARLPAVNPVDVLTQITTEVIDHMAETAHRLPSTAGPRSSNSNRKPDTAEVKRKRAILHHFKQSLSDSLFDVTAALDAGNALSSRLRGLTKQRVQLREELLAVRKQKEEVAINIDRVRWDHKRWQEKTTNRDELSAELWDLEMAVSSGRRECAGRREQGEEVAEPVMDIDMLAAVMSETVGGAGRGGGLAEKVEHLNTVLERTAVMLEGHAA